MMKDTAEPGNFVSAASLSGGAISVAEPPPKVKLMRKQITPHADLTDGRKIGEWETRWTRRAKVQIGFECAYAGGMFIVTSVLFLRVRNGSIRDIIGISPLADIRRLRRTPMPRWEAFWAVCS